MKLDVFTNLVCLQKRIVAIMQPDKADIYFV